MLTAGQPSPSSFTALAHNPQPVEFGLEQRDRAHFRIAPEDQPDGRRLRLIDDQLAVLDVVAERHVAAHPHALLLRRGDLVADALAGDLALELGEGEQHVERQAPHGGRRIELLRHRHKGRIVRIENVDNLGEIGKRPCQPIDLVDNDDLNVPGLDVLQKPLEGRPLHRPAGQATVVIHVAKRDPAGVTLAHDIGLARLPLGVERIEFLLEALVGRFAGVDRATDGEPGSCEISLRHRPPPPLSENPAAAS
jgi:hypothetical protein